MGMNDTLFSARPIGFIDGPREDYKPSNIPPYRRDEGDNFILKMSRKTKMERKKTENRIENEVKETKLNTKNAESKNHFNQFSGGTYKQKVREAVMAGKHLTSEIVVYTGIPRKAAIKAISSLIHDSKVLKDGPVPESAEKGDRYVLFVDGANHPSQVKKHTSEKPVSTIPNKLQNVSSHLLEEGGEIPRVETDKSDVLPHKDRPVGIESVRTQKEPDVNLKTAPPLDTHQNDLFITDFMALYGETQKNLEKMKGRMDEMYKALITAQAEAECYKKILHDFRQTMGVVEKK